MNFNKDECFLKTQALFFNSTPVSCDTFALYNRLLFTTDFVYALLTTAQRDFHDMFKRTYGVMYENNADLFQNYFQELKVYYDKGNNDPAESTGNFFASLYQKMFQVRRAETTMLQLNK